jgi:restriction system protein
LRDDMNYCGGVGMEDDEPALLHEPDLMLAILRAAHHAPASLDDAMARLHARLAAAHEPLTVPEGDLRRRLERAALLLRGADAIALAGDDRFRLTARGARLLDEHPDGVDESLLCTFPEFRTFFTALSPKRFEDDPRLPAFQAGMQAFVQRRSIAENPHAFDSVDHLAWECGWSEARDANQHC